MRDKKQRLKVNRNSGVASLATTLILGGVILEIAVAGAVLVMILTSGSYGERLTAQAFDAAKSGADDAFLKLARQGGSSDFSWTFYYGSGASADVAFTAGGVCTSGCSGTVTSLGKALNKRRNITAKVELDSGGQLKVLLVTVEPL